MPIRRTSIESSIPMTTTNELTNEDKVQLSEMNLSMEYETPPVDSLPMDDDDDDDEEEYESDVEEQEIAYSPACHYKHCLLMNDTFKGHVFTCLYCTTAYHGHERCLPAGSLSIAFSSSICCPIHLPSERKLTRPCLARHCYICEQPTRAMECFVCIDCPTTIHQSCFQSKTDETPTNWKCDPCLSDLKPLYGDICWIRMGKYRCWPSRILHERHAPDNLLAQERAVGEFLVNFFGSKEFFWANKHHYLSFENRCIQPKDLHATEPSFRDGLREARRLYGRLKQFYSTNPVVNYGEATKLEEMTLDDAYDEFEDDDDDDDDDDDTDDESLDMNSDESITNDNEKTSTVSGRSKLIDRSANKHGHMPIYRHTKTLKPVGEAQILRVPLAELSRCDCDPNKPDPCSSDEHCLNRMLKYECHPHVCAAGE
ncbi:unnamed protein product [Rotaria magnacalcarata]|uniref:Uncharacterized protein n=1 Tax=Rotaria magnacalcarata TaxID=392030 RepID=A0A8S2LUV4_9BILA|nr:unnamed protein product [Rotaria magnacalcarata]